MAAPIAIAVADDARARRPFEPILEVLPEAALVRWDDPTAGWEEVELAIPIGVWDYPGRLGELLAWCDRLDAAGVRCANATDVVRWNADKRYLRQLEAAGVPVVPTTWLSPGAAPDPAAWPDGPLVVKPTVSAGARRTTRHDDPAEAVAAAAALLADGWHVMVQPYQRAVDDVGETAIVHLGGAFSHAIRKAAILGADGRPAVDPTDPPVVPRVPSAEEHEVAAAALAAGPGDLLYARVDLLPGPDGPVVVELEVLEPNLFLTTAPGSAERFASAARALLR